MAIRCAVAIRGTNIPFIVLFTSKMELASAVLPSVFTDTLCALMVTNPINVTDNESRIFFIMFVFY